ncbi:lactate utilization protein C [Paenibacillus sp. N3/727]|uniref:LutC/YkgG family protein n=1 Tax=Paenibacillus sp. N3/727 TaxID=2925845 RepID=UPI001F5371D7|nr:lactate utilization protein C [Paenibacillus sp. N3/727]UNK16498.1 lactate utilization protein C [Paenibacillus sp. N3/727]
MSKQQSDQEWLAQLEAQSRKKQESFINGIAAKLNRARVREKPDHPNRGAPDFWNEFSWSLDNRIHQFTVNFEAAGGHVVHLSNMEQVKQFITEKAGEMSAGRILRQNQEMLDQLDLGSALPDTDISVWNENRETDWRSKAAEADFGIVLADYAAAYTGSMVVLSSKDKGRAVSLLPTVLIAIIPVERLKTRLGEILVNFDMDGRGNLPAGIHFISGPSRSADIENDLTIGVHGPGIVYALIVDHM